MEEYILHGDSKIIENDSSYVDVEHPTCDTPNDVIILSGQSNMSGRGGVQSKHRPNGTVYKKWDHVVPPEADAQGGTILRLNAKLHWVTAQEPLHYDIDSAKVCGVGPGLVFAASVLRHFCSAGETGPTIGLVPCAIGGTAIKEWEKGSRLYETMIQRSKAAIKDNGTLKALLWYQGESDTLAAENVKEFPGRLEALFNNIRADLGIESLPIIQVGITAKDHPYPEFLEKVREAQKALKMPYVYYVDAAGLPLLEDNIHLTTQAQAELGKMLADMYIQNCLNW